MSGSPKHAPQPERRSGYDRSFDGLAAQSSPSHVPAGDAYDPTVAAVSPPRAAPEAIPGAATVALEMAGRALDRRRVTVEAWVDDDGALHVSIAGDRIAELVVDGPTPSATLTVDV